jgi:hypothetical protein
MNLVYFLTNFMSVCADFGFRRGQIAASCETFDTDQLASVSPSVRESCMGGSGRGVCCTESSSCGVFEENNEIR